MKNDPVQMLHLIAQTIYDKKGHNILALDVREVSTLTNYFLIAEGTVDRHVKSLAHAVLEKMKDKGEIAANIEGEEVGDWIVIDYLDIIIHLFTPGLRDRYRLEELWNAGKIVDLVTS